MLRIISGLALEVAAIGLCFVSVKAIVLLPEMAVSVLHFNDVLGGTGIS